jgi:hypothetical protein
LKIAYPLTCKQSYWLSWNWMIHHQMHQCTCWHLRKEERGQICEINELTGNKLKKFVFATQKNLMPFDYLYMCPLGMNLTNNFISLDKFSLISDPVNDLPSTHRLYGCNYDSCLNLQLSLIWRYVSITVTENQSVSFRHNSFICKMEELRMKPIYSRRLLL